MLINMFNDFAKCSAGGKSRLSIGLSHFLFVFGLMGVVSFNSVANVTKKASLAEKKLELWVDKTLTSKVLESLISSPYYRNKPLLLIVEKGGKTQPRIDRLHAFVKRRLSEQLLNHQVNIINGTQSFIPAHHRMPSVLKCDPHNGVKAYLALELSIPSVNEIRYKFRFIDAVNQRKPSRYFEDETELKLWRYIAEDWQQMSVDEGLRGLRHLPFRMDQPDLMAKYLAHNLSCLLRLKVGASLTLAVDSPALMPPLDTVVANLSSYLAQHNEVTMHTIAEQANYVIRVDAHLIDQWHHLYQVRATVEDLRTHELLGGVPTSSYMSMKDVQPSEHNKVVLEPVSKPQSKPKLKPIYTELPRLNINTSTLAKPLSIECVSYIDGSSCNGPFERLDKPWMVKFKADSRYQGAMVIASLIDEVGNDFRQITGHCSVLVDGTCDIKFLSDAGLYKGGFAIEAAIYQGDASHPVTEDNYFKQIYYTK